VGLIAGALLGLAVQRRPRFAGVLLFCGAQMALLTTLHGLLVKREPLLCVGAALAAAGMFQAGEALIERAASEARRITGATPPSTL
jgi:hypothetical protein